jgi:UDP-N-acetylmuramoylalanine--D-glutamate ligase
VIDLESKKVLIFGMGVSGKAAAELALYKGAQVFALSKGPTHEWNNGLLACENCFNQDEPDSLKHIPNVDILVLSPGIPTDHEVVCGFVKAGAKLYSEIEFAYQCSKKNSLRVGVTGTNGKTTTVSLLGELFKAAGMKTFVGGNIGIPYSEGVLRELKGEEFDLICLELSSFQLEQIEQLHFHAAAILNITSNHGERYDQFEDYALAKQRIQMNLTSEDSFFILKGSICESWGSLNGKVTVLPCEDKLVREQCSGILESFKLPGPHNRQNLMFALSITRALGVQDEKIEAAVSSFKGVEHRLELIETNRNFKVFNDAKSTNWQATAAAIDSVAESFEDLILVVGGQKRGRGETPIQIPAQVKSKVTAILAIGESADDVVNFYERDFTVVNLKNLENVVRWIDEKGFEGAVLFSPAYPSFDQFKNYVARGVAFKEAWL